MAETENHIQRDGGKNKSDLCHDVRTGDRRGDNQISTAPEPKDALSNSKR